ncbi:MAG: 2-amino-4-hydroxy-6-hydroxymethyldihydropteridine diphosphokinase [Treponema sp.]|nr:2-amino-4-hydroxy-6-hydroxymethyldihydropteridine diphosphokinase [Treponema sp.]
MTPVALGLGSNKSYGGRSCMEILRSAVSELSEHLSGLEVSGVYKTRAMYYEDQDDFYNMAVLGCVNDAVDDNAGAFDLLEKIHKIEAAFGRDRSAEIRNGPRSLDIDIELYGSQTINTENLVVPHPRLKERAFVLVPLVEILAKDADNIKWKGFGSEKILELKGALTTLCGQGIALEIDAEAFSSYIKEEDYGTRNVGTNKGPGK